MQPADLPRIEVVGAPCLIGRVAEEFGPLSNMSPHAVESRGVQWPRAEHLFQSLRFTPDMPVWSLLRREANPMRAKTLAKQALAGGGAVVQPRSELDVENMRCVIRLKCHQHATVRDLLLGTGDRTIIEDCSRRAGESGLFWGARRVVTTSVAHRDQVQAQRHYLAGLPSRTPIQESALAHMEAELKRRTEVYWEGHNWLGRLWMELRAELRGIA